MQEGPVPRPEGVKGRIRFGFINRPDYCLSANKCTKGQAGHGFINVAGAILN